jgi:hypothetical protein
MRRKPSKPRKNWKAHEEEQPTHIDFEVEISGVSARGRVGSWSTRCNAAYFVNEKTPVCKLVANDYVSTKNLLPDYGGMTPASKLPPTGSVTRYQVDDVLVSNIRPYLKKVWHSDRNGGRSDLS